MNGKNLLVMPYSSFALPDGTETLSLETKLACIAASEMFKEGGITRVIAIAEQTYKGTGTTAALMKQEMMQRGVPEHAIETHAPFNSSAAQLEKLHALYPDMPCTILAFDFHLLRIERIALRLGIRAEYSRIEDALERANPRYADVLRAWRESPEIRQKLAKERALVQPLDRLDGFLFRCGARTHLLQHAIAGLQGPRPPMTSGIGPALPANA